MEKTVIGRDSDGQLAIATAPDHERGVPFVARSVPLRRQQSRHRIGHHRMSRTYLPEVRWYVREVRWWTYRWRGCGQGNGTLRAMNMVQRPAPHRVWSCGDGRLAVGVYYAYSSTTILWMSMIEGEHHLHIYTTAVVVEVSSKRSVPGTLEGDPRPEYRSNKEADSAGIQNEHRHRY